MDGNHTAEADPRLRGLLHAGGLAVLVPLGVVLVAAATSAAARFTATVYVLFLWAMLAISALYHRTPRATRRRRLLRRADHSMIFLAIAATYTPIATLGLNGWARPVLLWLVWTGAGVGILVRWLTFDLPPWAVALPYVIVGWAALVALEPLARGLGMGPFVLVFGGGVAYTLGALAFALRRPDPWPRTFGYHEVFHGFTLVGAFLQFAAVCVLVRRVG